MRRSTTTATIGAIAGVVVALVGIAMSAGLVIDDAAGFTVVDAATGSGRGTITAGTDALYLYVLGFGLVGGGAIGYLTAAVARSWRPAEPRFGPGVISVLGAVAGAITAYVVLRAGIGIGGSITNEVVTISAFRGVVTFAAAGAVAGAVVAIVAEKYSREAALGLEGEAWPKTVAAFMTESLPAMLIPALAIVLIAGTVIGLAQIFLAGGTIGAIVVASLLAVGALAGAAFLAHRGDSPAQD